MGRHSTCICGCIKKSGRPGTGCLFLSNLHLSYLFKLPWVKSAKVGLTVYNLFDEEYENNGYAGSGFYYDGGEKIRYNYTGYATQAGTNVLGHLNLNF